MQNHMISEKESFMQAVSNLSKFFAFNGNKLYIKQCSEDLKKSGLHEQSEKMRKICESINFQQE
jgi:hypothetical protein